MTKTTPVKIKSIPNATKKGVLEKLSRHLRIRMPIMLNPTRMYDTGMQMVTKVEVQFLLSTLLRYEATNI